MGNSSIQSGFRSQYIKEKIVMPKLINHEYWYGDLIVRLVEVNNNKATIVYRKWNKKFTKEVGVGDLKVLI